MKSNIKHNKLRNTGILFELLARQITSDILNNVSDSKAIVLMKEFFGSTKELGKELILYRTFFNVHNLSEVKAFQLLSLVSEQHKKLDQNALNFQKYMLIREIKNAYDIKAFFSTKIPSYKVYASIYKTFDAALNGISDTNSVEELASSQFTIVEHLSGRGSRETQEISELSTIIRGQDEDIRYLSYKILIERFNKKYESLDGAQKKLLQEYIYNISNTNNLKEYSQIESKKLADDIAEYSKKVKNKVIRIKLSEIVSQLTKIKTVQTIKENHITAMLIAYEILKELKSL